MKSDLNAATYIDVIAEPQYGGRMRFSRIAVATVVELFDFFWKERFWSPGLSGWLIYWILSDLATQAVGEMFSVADLVDS